MIRKINSLISVGKYRNFTATGPVDLKKLTIIFGDNGSGKTTLTSILRSLSTNNNQLIKSRKSTNTGTPQSCQIIERISGNDTHHTFHHTNGWNSNMPNIEIFDIHFVNENIYSGFEFNEEHKKHLHQFVIGAQGVVLKQQIEQNKNDKSNSRISQQQFKDQVISAVGFQLTSTNFAQFVAIPQSHSQNIDSQIAQAQIKLNNASSQAIINTLAIPINLNSFSTIYDFNTLKTDLQTTAESIQSEALNLVFSTHCSELRDNELDSPESWVKNGFNYTLRQKSQKDNGEIANLSCPYCKQELNETLEIISSYTQKFNEQFRLLSARTNDHLTKLENLNFVLHKQEIQQTIQSNTTNITAWLTHLPANTNTPQINLDEIYAQINAFKLSLITDIKQALQDPTQLVSTENAIELERMVGLLNKAISEYNQEIGVFAGLIQSFKQGIPSVALATTEIENLNRIKKRFEPQITTLLGQLATEKSNLTALTQNYTQLIQQQETTANAFFSTYCTRINYYLTTVFKTEFKIDDVVNVAPQGRGNQSKIGYTLTFDNQPISFQTGQQYSVKQCLSEGDKSTIALAFFLAKLDVDTNTPNKILVFDDPLSSLDTKRRGYTIRVIRNYITQMKQVIVLSHVEHFLHEIQKDIATADKSTLRIEENFVTKESKIKECDLEELVKNKYFKDIESLENFRTNPDISLKDSVLGWLRNVLESHLGFKFYKELRSMNGHKMFGRIITHLESNNVVFKEDADRTNIIANLKLINAMSWKVHHGTATPNYTTHGMDPNSITLTELDNLIVDTLDLIENKL